MDEGYSSDPEIVFFHRDNRLRRIIRGMRGIRRILGRNLPMNVQQQNRGDVDEGIELGDVERFRNDPIPPMLPMNLQQQNRGDVDEGMEFEAVERNIPMNRPQENRGVGEEGMEFEAVERQQPHNIVYDYTIAENEMPGQERQIGEGCFLRLMGQLLNIVRYICSCEDGINDDYEMEIGSVQFNHERQDPSAPDRAVAASANGNEMIIGASNRGIVPRMLEPPHQQHQQFGNHPQMHQNANQQQHPMNGRFGRHMFPTMSVQPMAGRQSVSGRYQMSMEGQQKNIPNCTFGAEEFTIVTNFLLKSIVPTTFRKGAFVWMDEMLTSLSQGCSGIGEKKEIEISDEFYEKWRWLLSQTAGFIVLNKMKTPIGKPMETLNAFSTEMNRLAKEVLQNGKVAKGKSSKGSEEENRNSKYPTEWLRVRLLLEFVDILDKLMTNAMNGGASFNVLEVTNLSRTFFTTNAQSCNEWLHRTYYSSLVTAFFNGYYPLTIRFGWNALMGYQKRARDEKSVGMAVSIGCWMTRAMCALSAPKAIIGVRNWIKEEFGTDMGRDIMEALELMAESRYETALVMFESILVSESNLSETLKLIIYNSMIDILNRLRMPQAVSYYRNVLFTEEESVSEDFKSVELLTKFEKVDNREKRSIIDWNIRQKSMTIESAFSQTMRKMSNAYNMTPNGGVIKQNSAEMLQRVRAVRRQVADEETELRRLRELENETTMLRERNQARERQLQVETSKLHDEQAVLRNATMRVQSLTKHLEEIYKRRQTAAAAALVEQRKLQLSRPVAASAVAPPPPPPPPAGSEVIRPRASVEPFQVVMSSPPKVEEQQEEVKKDDDFTDGYLTPVSKIPAEPAYRAPSPKKAEKPPSPSPPKDPYPKENKQTCLSTFAPTAMTPSFEQKINSSTIARNSPTSVVIERPISFVESLDESRLRSGKTDLVSLRSDSLKATKRRSWAASEGTSMTEAEMIRRLLDDQKRGKNHFIPQLPTPQEEPATTGSEMEEQPQKLGGILIDTSGNDTTTEEEASSCSARSDDENGRNLVEMEVVINEEEQEEEEKKKKPQVKGILRRPNEKMNKGRIEFDPLALLLDAALEGELDLVKTSAAKLLDVSQANDEGITALHNAICAGHYEIVRFLIEHDADVNAQDSDGWTPLHCAASCFGSRSVSSL